MGAQTLGHREASRLADDHVGGLHELGHGVHVAEYRDVGQAVFGHLAPQLALVVLVGPGDDHQLDRGHRVHEGEHLPDGGTEVHIGLGELRPGERQHHLFVLRQSEGLAGLGAVVGSREGGAAGMPVMRMRSSGTRRGRSVSAMDSLATQNRSVCRWGHSPSAS